MNMRPPAPIADFLAQHADEIEHLAPPAAAGPAANGVVTFEDWSEYTRVEGVVLWAPKNAEDVAGFCNQAASEGIAVRALGHAHNWSPLILPPGTPPRPKVMLLDTKHLTDQSHEIVNGELHVTFGTGTTLDAATEYLESIDNQGAGVAPGYTFLNMPTIGSLTLGGILAVGGHGTSVPFAGVSEPDLMGCLSNLIVSFKAVTTDPDDPTSHEYAVRSFERSELDASAFLVHLGRAFITEVTLLAVPNFYLQTTSVIAPMKQVMAPPSSQPNSNAFSTLLDSHGRVEVIWFPYQTEAWVQCKTRQTREIQPQVQGPYFDYKWMNWISQPVSSLFKSIFAATPSYTADYMTIEAGVAAGEMGGKILNGTSRDIQLYLTDNTFRMTILGYVLQLPRANVQQAVSEFFAKVASLLDAYEHPKPPETPLYPVNGAVEIRCTTVDRQADLGIAGARPPALSATHSVDASDPTLDTVLWVDVLTFPDTAGANQFFTDLETWMITTWAPEPLGRLRPEWSKGWAYTPTGPWTNTDLYQKWLPSVYDQATDTLTFDWAKQTLAKYDAANIYSNGFLAQLFA